ncbi:MAG: hypothetical protein JW774_08040 [Candidatus Aureabacteria bacterium]|nr:hypothetical protein [Candidatus Auribacterota bacterium]
MLAVSLVFLAYEQPPFSQGSLLILTIAVLCFLINLVNLIANVISFYRSKFRHGLKYKTRWWKPYPSAHDAETLPLQHQVPTLPLQDLKPGNQD